MNIKENIILLIYLIVGIITYDGIISTLPVIAAIIYTSVLWQDNLKIIRIGTEEHKIEYFYSEVTNKNTNRWSAIQFLAKQLGIKQEEIIKEINEAINIYTAMTAELADRYNINMNIILYSKVNCLI